MKKLLLISLAAFVYLNAAAQQTMTFNSGPAETGFSFSGWASGGTGTIWLGNLASPASVSINSGTWDFTSFTVAPFGGANNMRVTSNKGDSYDYSDNTAGVHTLNWTGVTSVTFTRISGSGGASDHDNFIYTSYAPSCTDPSIPTVTYSPGTVCNGNTATLNISGTLNDATAWHVYSGSCGGTSVGSTATSSITVSPSSPSTTYYIRGQGGCVVPGSCGSVVVNVTALDDASFSYGASAYCVNAADPSPTITGLGGGTFSSTAGLSIASNGVIDVSASTPGTYTVTYTTSGTCPNSSTQSVTINALDDASFSYGASAYCVNASDPTPTITGLGGGTLSSSAGLSISTNGVIDVSASTPGTYTVTYTTAGACPNSSSQSVSINALDDASFSYGASAYCVNAADPSPTITGLAGGTFGSTAGLSIASNGVIDVSASTPGTYTVTYTTAGTCPNSSSQSVTINALDDASFSYGASAYCVNASDPTPTITGLGGGTFSSSPAGLSLNTSSGAIDVSTSTPNVYTVTYTTAGICSNSSMLSVTINALPTVDLGVDVEVCNGGSVTLNSNATGAATLSYSWTNSSETTPSITVSPSNTTSYQVSVTDGNTCVNTDELVVNVLPAANALASNNGPVCENNEAQLTASGGSAYKWYNANGVYLSNLKKYSFTAKSNTAGIYKVVVFNQAGCKDSANTTLAVVPTTAGTLETITACNEYTWSKTSFTYTLPGMYLSYTQTASECFADTLLLDLNYSTSDTLLVETCEIYTSEAGNTYNATGVYTEHFTNASGCDSTLVLKIVVGTIAEVIEEENCDAYTWDVTGETYTETGLYTHYFGSGTACDSAIVLDLTILPKLEANIVYQNADTLKANDGGIAYFWVDCASNEIIPGANGQTFVPSKNGSYAAQVVSSNGCIDVSSCALVTSVGIQQHVATPSFTLYPNPTNGIVHIDISNVSAEFTITVNDVSGKLISEISTQSSSTTVDLSEQVKGVYFITITSANTQPIIKRIVKM